jgi:hypothetical protein
MPGRFSSFSSFDNLRYKCATCEEVHQGLPGLGFSAPRYWSDNVDRKTSYLTADTCVIHETDFFLRGLLQVPIINTSGHLGWGVWSSASRKSFELYLSGEVLGDDHTGDPFFGWFSNSLPGYEETLSLKCSLTPQKSDLRPLIEIEPSSHQLSIDQREGITVERALEFVELSGIRILSV